MKTTINRRERYARLRSMEQLLAEKAKLRRSIRTRERALRHDVELVREQFSFSALSGMILDRVYRTSPFLQKAVAGFNVVRNIITGRRGSSCDCHDGDHYGEHHHAHHHHGHEETCECGYR